MEQTHMSEEDGFVFVTLKMDKAEYENLITEALKEIADGEYQRRHPNAVPTGTSDDKE